MKNTQMRQGVSQANRVIRKLKLDKPLEEDISAAVGEINELPGMDEVSVDEKSGVLRLAYDAGRLSIDGIEAVLSQHGVALSDDWWTRMKKNQYRFVDQNVKDNAAYVPSCCNKMPPGAGSK
jgi:hypothetical protein